jgi:chromosome segregation ATPase
MVKTATPPTVKRSPADIAAAVGEEQDRQRRERIRADVEAWRELVRATADGGEPDKKTLSTLGELCERLQAPANSVAVGVDALAEDRKLGDQLAVLSERLRDLKKREKDLRLRLETARQELRAAEAEAADFGRVSQIIPHVLRARTEARLRAPLLFADLDTVVNCLVTASERAGGEAYERLQQRRGNGGWQS